MNLHIPNKVIATFTIPNVGFQVQLVSVRRYPTNCLHTNRQLEALNILFAGRRVQFWDEVLS